MKLRKNSSQKNIQDARRSSGVRPGVGQTPDPRGKKLSEEYGNRKVRKTGSKVFDKALSGMIVRAPTRRATKNAVSEINRSVRVHDDHPRPARSAGNTPASRNDTRRTLRKNKFRKKK